MLQSQKTVRPPRTADIPRCPVYRHAYDISPALAAADEDSIAAVMHKTCGLNGKLPTAPSEFSGRHDVAESNKAIILEDIRKNGPSKTVEIALRTNQPRQRVANYCSNLRREGRLSLKQVKPGFPATWELSA